MLCALFPVASPVALCHKQSQYVTDFIRVVLQVSDVGYCLNVEQTVNLRVGEVGVLQCAHSIIATQGHTVRPAFTVPREVQKF